MNKENKVFLADMRDSLQKQLHYGNPQAAFNDLLYGWCRSEKRTNEFLYQLRKKGWMSRIMAKRFEAYCGYKMT